MTLSEYREKARDLNFIEPFERCCGETLQPVDIEPLGGRSFLTVNRMCIVQCSKCKGKFISRWD